MDISTTFSDVLQKANDGKSAEMSEKISQLLNEEWQKLTEALSAEGLPPVVSLSFSPTHEKFIDILAEYIDIDEDDDNVLGSLDNMNLVASVYSTVNPETGEDDLAIDMDYYYGDTEFAPALYNGRELMDGEKIKKFDHIPTTIDIIRMCVEFNSGTPLFDIDKNAPFYDNVAPFLGGNEDAGTDTLGGEDEPYPREKKPKIDPRAHMPAPIVVGADTGDDESADEPLEIPEECQTCNPRNKCPSCPQIDQCALPCYEFPNADDSESDAGDADAPESV